MTIKWKYIIFIGLIHVLIAVMAWYLLEDRIALFLLVELGVIISLALAYRIYTGFVRPLQFMVAGTDAILDRDFSVKYRKTGSREMDKLVDTYNAMIDNIRRERVWMEEQNFFLDQLIEASPAGIVLLDYDNRIVRMNPGARQILAPDRDTTGQTLAALDHPVATALDTLSSGESRTVLGPQGERFKCSAGHFIHRGFKRRFFVIQELSRELQEAEKRAYGKVIRMMAHEVNNSLGAVNSIMDSAIDYLQESSQEDAGLIREGLETAVARNDRLSQFMRNFAEVVKLPPPQLEVYPVSRLVRDTARLMESQAAQRGVTFEYRGLAADSLKARLDPRQMEQALVNIVKNALEAIDGQGQIRFSIEKNPLRIIVSDTGKGITPGEQENLFTPFYSSKPDGQGIGLTLVREIVTNHGGTVSLTSDAAGWTHCVIRL